MMEWDDIRFIFDAWMEKQAWRRWLNENPFWVYVITFLTVVLLILIIAWPKGHEIRELGDFKKRWYYDLNTGEVFTAKQSKTGLVDAPSGPLPDGDKAGVAAYVLSYDYKPTESQRFIGFLFVEDPNYVRKRNAVTDPDGWIDLTSKSGKYIRELDDPNWYPFESEDGRWIYDNAFDPDGFGELPHYVQPE